MYIIVKNVSHIRLKNKMTATKRLRMSFRRYSIVAASIPRLTSSPSIVVRRFSQKLYSAHCWEDPDSSVERLE